MGNFFKSLPTQSINKTLISLLRQKTSNKINEICLSLTDFYPGNSILNYEEFTDVFSDFFVDQTDAAFDLLKNDSHVDVYELLATIVVFSKQEFSEKLLFIFSLFDFDKSGEIERKELVLTLQASIRGLCKLVTIKPPELKQIESFSSRLFIQVDTDGSSAISFQEFQKYMSNSEDLQDFLLKYAQIQTYENAQRRQAEIMKKFNQIFNKLAGEEKNVESQLLFKELAQDYSESNQEELTKLMAILENTSRDIDIDLPQGWISKVAFQDVLQAWSAFDATDINNDLSVDINELKFLLFAYEGDIPDDFRVQEEMDILDKDKSGQINRSEWLNYLCVEPENSGKCVFRNNLKNLFNKYDKDNSGFLTKEEIKSMIVDNLNEFVVKYSKKSKQDQEDLAGMIEQLAQETILQLDQGNNKTINWIEFKNFMEKSMRNIEKLRKFLIKTQ